MASLLSLPDEILLDILYQLSAGTVVSCAQTCRRLRAVCATNELWRHLCLHRWKRWNDDAWDLHQCNKTLRSSALRKTHNHSNWKESFIRRTRQDQSLESLLSRLTAETDEEVRSAFQTLGEMRLECLEWIHEFLVHNGDQYPLRGPLSLVFYARRWLERAKSFAAYQEWDALDNEDPYAVEDAALILCRWRDPTFDATGVKQQLDELAGAIAPKLDGSKALAAALCEFLFGSTENGGCGFSGDKTSYYDVDNCFLDKCLETKKSIPITLSALYCAIAVRCNFEVEPVNTPLHFLLRVHDGAVCTYIDCFNNALLGEDEVHVNLASSVDERCTATAMGARMVANLLRSYRTIGDAARDESREEGLELQLLSASNAALPAWLGFIERKLRWSFLDACAHFELFIEKHPDRLTEDEQSQILEQWRRFRDMQRLPGPPREKGNTQYFVGQVIRHRKYGYNGVIYGWDDQCVASHAWQRSMGIHMLDRGAEQPYYHVMPDTRQRVGDTYVAEDNIEVVECDAQPIHNMKVGRYFTRFIPQKSRYVPTGTVLVWLKEENECHFILCGRPTQRGIWRRQYKEDFAWMDEEDQASDST